MTREDIIRMAREATKEAPREDWNTTAWVFGEETLERFAQLVETAVTEAVNARANKAWTLMCEKMVEVEIHEAVLEEREACAQIAFSWNTPTTDQVAKEIRTRGNK